jgi:antitoxin component YwqK of YwqJK toxin-antitoxin module
MHRFTRKMVLSASLLLGGAPLALAVELPSSPINAVSRMPEEITLETITERYASGKTKLTREVAMDVDLNFVNHGQFQMFDEAGNVISEGRFEAGQRIGPWTRTYRADESPLFGQSPFKRFPAPYTSEVTFENGHMQGTWTISDAQGRKISEIEFVDGLREGKLIYFNTNGQVAREIDFKGGVIDGYDRTYNDAGEVTAENQYVDGRMIVVKGDTYISTKKKTEGAFLYPRMIVATRDNWFDATLATFTNEEGEPVRHGPFNAWHVNGQPSTKGEYAFGQPVGEFTWWHPNGQVAIRGAFDTNGKHDGDWQWWHANGMRAAKGQYTHGTRVGRWMQWSEEGALTSTKEHGGGQSVVEGEIRLDTNSAARPRRIPSSVMTDEDLELETR